MVVGVEEGVGETQSFEESPLPPERMVMPVRSSKLVGLVRVELEPFEELKRPPVVGLPFKSQPKSTEEEMRVPLPALPAGLELFEW